MAAPASAYLTDSAIHPPPTTGAYAYYKSFGTFGPDQAGFIGKGQAFIDPVFGSTIRRLTNELGRQSNSDIYAKNGFWNANGTRMFHNDSVSKTIIDTDTGAVVRSGVPGNFDSSFAPDDPDTWYYVDGSSLMKYSIASGASTTVKTFGGTLGPLGGSVDWIDRSGRYMVLNIGGSGRVWDKQSDVLYAGTISAGVGSGWVGISPDGNYVVAASDGGVHQSFAINHAARSVNTTGVLFWTLCGDHGDLVSATNGKTYFVTWECTDDPGIWAADITIPQTAANADKQRADSRKLVATSWSDDGHISAVSRGTFQDWAYVSLEAKDDAFTAGVTGWRTYKQEIVMANVLTGEVRRIAHHRSRGIDASYYYQPRVSASWDGTRVAWASNFGYNGTNYTDIYTTTVGASASVPPPPPPAAAPTASFTNPASGATVSGAATVTITAAGGSGTGYTYKLAVDGANVYNGANGTTSWNTTNVTNGSHTLTATVTDSANNSGTATRTVTVSNAVTPPPTAALTTAFMSPAAGATVSGMSTIGATIAGGAAGTRTIKLTVDGTMLSSQTTTGTSVSYGWNTSSVTNGSHTLAATVTDAAGTTATATRAVTVSNAAVTPPPPPPTGALKVSITQPLRSAVVGGTTWAVLWVEGAGAGSKTYTLSAGGATVVTQVTTSSGPVSVPWNTLATPNGVQALTATVTDAAGKTGSVSMSVTVNNGGATVPPATGLTAAFTSPAAGTTVSGTSTVGMSVSGSTASTRTFTLAVDGTPVSTQTLAGAVASYAWNTSGVSNGSHTLTATVTDSAGKTASVTRAVTVSNGTSTTPAGTLKVTITQPRSGEVVRGTAWAVIWVEGASGSSNTYTLSANGQVVYRQTTSSTGPVSMPWNTIASGNGSKTLTATVQDATGKTGTTSITVTVSN